MASRRRARNNEGVFFIFAMLQALSLGFIVFFLLGGSGIGPDTRIVLSILFPLFTFIVEYIIFLGR